MRNNEELRQKYVCKKSNFIRVMPYGVFLRVITHNADCYVYAMSYAILRQGKSPISNI